MGGGEGISEIGNVELELPEGLPMLSPILTPSLNSVSWRELPG